MAHTFQIRALLQAPEPVYKGKALVEIETLAGAAIPVVMLLLLLAQWVM